MHFLEKAGGVVEGMNMLKQRHMNKFMFRLFMQWLTDNLAFSKIVSQNKAPIHKKILLWTYVSLRLCSAKIIKAPEKCKQHILDLLSLSESRGLCWREKKAQCESCTLHELKPFTRLADALLHVLRLPGAGPCCHMFHWKAHTPSCRTCFYL